MSASPILHNSLPLACVGGGGHGRVVAAQWRARYGGNPIFVDSAIPRGETRAGMVVRWSSLTDVTDHQIIIGIGDNLIRRRLQAEAVEIGLPLARFVADPHSYFGFAPEAGAVVLAGAIVNINATIGEGVIINSGAIVEHDCQIGEFSHLSPGACIGGDCRIGADVWIGANATVIPRLAITSGTVIGAGSTVIRSIHEAGVYVGTPARRIR